MVAQVAAEDPDTVPKIAQQSMFTCINRPGSQPSHGESPSNISSESLVRYRISPIQTNIGSAASVHEALDPQNDWNRFTSGGVLVKNCRPNQATAAREMAIHTPPISRINSSEKRISPTARGVIPSPRNRRRRGALLQRLGRSVSVSLTPEEVHPRRRADVPPAAGARDPRLAAERRREHAQEERDNP